MQRIKKLFLPMDLTKGKPWKVILLFAIPILISTLLNNAFSLINSIVLKITVGGDSVTAINQTGPISSILFNFAYGCSGGFAVISANKHGAKDEDGIKSSFYHSLFFSIIIAILIMIIGLIFYKDLLVILKVHENFIDKSAAYYQIILFSFIFMMLSNYLSNFLRAIGESYVPLIISIISTIINIIFAFLLTGVIKLDTRGVGIATLIANIFTIAASFIYIFKKYPYLHIKKMRLKYDKEMGKSLLKIGLPLGFQWSILFIGSFINAEKVNSFGDLAQKAVGCYNHMEGYLTIPLSVMASALLSFVGQNYGAGEIKRIKDGIKKVLIVDIICYFFILLIGYLLIPYVPYIFLRSEELMGDDGQKILYYSSTYLKILLPFLILQGIVQMSRSSLQGIKKPLIPFISGIGELIARTVICQYLPILVNPNNPLSNESYVAISFATPIAWLISAIIMGGSVIYFIFIKKIDLNNNDMAKK